MAHPLPAAVPAGVASHFLDILAGDQKAGRRRMSLWIVLAIALLAPAFYLDGWRGAAVHAGALVAGVLAGLLVARVRVRSYEDSIRGTWSQWMRYSVAAETVAEVFRKVRGRSGRNLPYLYASLLTLIWGAEGLLLVLALVGQNGAGLLLALPFIAANGLMAGILLGFNSLLTNWFGSFRSTVREMVDDGELPLWGVA
jgi:hypothetical protein